VAVGLTLYLAAQLAKLETTRSAASSQRLIVESGVLDTVIDLVTQSF